MSWHYLQGQEAASWEADCLDGAPSALLRLIPMRAESCLLDRLTDALADSQSGTTCEPSTECAGADELTLCRVASRAKTLAPPAKVLDSAESEAVCGEKWPGSLAKYDRASHLWRTRQFSLLGGLDEFLETWPKWGLMRSGECWALATLEHATDATGFGFVPTVLTSEATGPGLHGNGSHNFRTWFRENSTERRLPLHGEIMMLWPVGWASAGVPLETDKFQQWLLQHGGF